MHIVKGFTDKLLFSIFILIQCVQPTSLSKWGNTINTNANGTKVNCIIYLCLVSLRHKSIAIKDFKGTDTLAILPIFKKCFVP